MPLSIFAARILAVTYIAAGIAALSGKISFQEMVAEFERSPGLTFISGFVTLILGMILVEYHNLWVNDWRVLITVVGWLSLLKGILLIAFPGYMKAFRGWYKNTKIWGVLMLALGILFAWFGFGA